VKLREIQRLRGLAVLLVMVHHAPLTRHLLPPWLCETWSGVDLFFVISGFVVTRALVADLDVLPPRAGVSDFYVRRVHRILPMVVFIVAATGACVFCFRGELVFGTAGEWARDAGLVFGGVYNYARNSIDHTALGALWSLCVEEHFYLVAPLALILLGDRRRRLAGCVVGIVAVGIIRALTPHVESLKIFDSHLRFDALLAGVTLALVPRLPSPSPRLTRFVLVPLALALLVIVPGVMPQPALNRIGLSLLWLCGALLVATAARDGNLVLPVGGRAWAWLGERSYSAYLVHPLVYGVWLEIARRRLFVPSTKPALLAVELVLLAAATALAALTYRLVEAPFIALGRARVASRRGRETHTHVPATHEPPGPAWQPLSAALVLVAAIAGGARAISSPPAGEPVWRGEYFAGTSFGGSATRHDAAALELSFGRGSPVAGVPAKFSARWRGCLVVARDRAVGFSLAVDGGVRLRVDDKIAIDRGAAAHASYEIPLPLKAGAHLVEVEFSDDGDGGVLVLRARLDGKRRILAAPDVVAPVERGGRIVCAPPSGVTAVF
jgi:peptidoglycan/LPS O-acetylase OafA/YrhL